MFAKLFDSQKYGQILMKAETDEHGKPEIKFYFEKKVGDNIVICNVAMPCRNDLRDKFFDEVDLDFAEDIIKD